MAIILSSHTRLVFLLASFAIVFANLSRDFPGPYCAQRHSCCNDREDSCSVPISTTLCYCDNFCERGISGDCCPDYDAFCLNITLPEPLTRCEHKGQVYPPLQPFHDNCNKCECLLNGDKVCEQAKCLVEDELLDTINRDRYRSWTGAAYPQFRGQKLVDGAIYRTGSLKPGRLPHLSHKLENIPPSYDARHTDMVSEVRDQGWCGSSWVLSALSVAQDRFAIQSKGQEKVVLSPQQIISCQRRHSLGCNGGRVDVAWNFFRKTGLVEEECFPYNDKKEQTPKCPASLLKPRNLEDARCSIHRNVDRTALYKVGPAYSPKNETDIQIDIMKYGPVQATMRVYQDFFYYKNGIYQHIPQEDDLKDKYHSVKIVGWGEQHSSSHGSTKYWIAANSWGTWWGEDGYFKIVRGENECNIESYVIAAWADDINKDTSKTYRKRHIRQQHRRVRQ